ncbi:MAG: hypothetical protein U1E63_15970 [Burkholderiales bacterium]
MLAKRPCSALLSQALLDDNHDAGHIAFEFGTNWLMFGALRRFAMFAEAAKLSAIAKGGGQMVLLASMTLAKAEIDKLVKTGKHADPAAKIAEIAVRGAGHVHRDERDLEIYAADVQTPGGEQRTNSVLALRANNAAISALRARAAALEGTKDLAAARKLVADERAWLEQRSEVLAEIREGRDRRAGQSPQRRRHPEEGWHDDGAADHAAGASRCGAGQDEECRRTPLARKSGAGPVQVPERAH